MDSFWVRFPHVAWRDSGFLALAIWSVMVIAGSTVRGGGSTGQGSVPMNTILYLMAYADMSIPGQPWARCVAMRNSPCPWRRRPVVRHRASLARPECTGSHPNSEVKREGTLQRVLLGTPFFLFSSSTFHVCDKPKEVTSRVITLKKEVARQSHSLHVKEKACAASLKNISNKYPA